MVKQHLTNISNFYICSSSILFQFLSLGFMGIRKNNDKD